MPEEQHAIYNGSTHSLFSVEVSLGKLRKFDNSTYSPHTLSEQFRTFEQGPPVKG